MPGPTEFNLCQPALDRKRKRCNLLGPPMPFPSWSPFRLAVCLGLLCFPACRALSPANQLEQAELSPPSSWQASKEARSGVDHDWISRFKDSRLQKMVDEALANNRDLRAAAARRDQALQQARIAGAAGLPSADLSFGGNRQKQNFIGFPVGGPGAEPGGVFSNTFNQFNLNLAVNWELDIWGRIRAGQAAATAEAEAAEQEIRAAQTSLAGQIASTWFSLCEAREQVALASEAESLFRQTAEAVRDRFARGQQEDGGAGAQLRLAETDVATAQAARVERQQALEQATRQLEILLGRYPAGQISSASLPSVPSKPPVGLPSELLQRRPDVLAAERRFAASGKRLSEARRALFPRLSLTTGGGTATGELGDLLKSDFGVWQLAGNVIQPIFTGGRLRAEANVRYAREREALADLQQTVLRAFGEVETALMAEKLLTQREASLASALSFARQADEAARADFASGVTDLLNVLSAQNRVVQLRAQLITLRRLRLENRINLHLALGGDFAAKPALASASAKPTKP